MLLLTEVIELKWLARKHSSNCHLDKCCLCSCFHVHFPSGEASPVLPGCPSRVMQQPCCSAGPSLTWDMPQSMGERDVRMNKDFACWSSVCKWSLASGQVGADQWGFKYKGNSGNLKVLARQPPIVQAYQRAEPRKDAAQLSATALLTHHFLETRAKKAWFSSRFLLQSWLMVVFQKFTRSEWNFFTVKAFVRPLSWVGNLLSNKMWTHTFFLTARGTCLVSHFPLWQKTCRTIVCLWKPYLSIGFGSHYVKKLWTQTNSIFGHGTTPARVQVFGQFSQTRGVFFWGCPVRGQELDFMVLVGLFQLRIFCDPMFASFS